MANGGRVDSDLCVSPVLYDAAGLPRMVVHLEHVLFDPSGERLARLHLHQVVDPLGQEPLEARYGAKGRMFVVSGAPAPGVHWMDVREFSQIQVDAREVQEGTTR